jgi:hypothetical protein
VKDFADYVRKEFELDALNRAKLARAIQDYIFLNDLEEQENNNVEQADSR